MEFALKRVAAAGLGDGRHEVREDVEDTAP